METVTAKAYKIGKSGQKLAGIPRRSSIEPGDEVLIIKMKDIIDESALIKNKIKELKNE